MSGKQTEGAMEGHMAIVACLRHCLLSKSNKLPFVLRVLRFALGSHEKQLP